MNLELDPRETTMVSKVEPISSGPASSGRHRSPLREVIDSLHGLSLAEMADVFRYVQRVRTSRGDRPSPEFISRLVAVISRLYVAYPDRVSISLVRAHFATVPRNLVEQALIEAETRHLLRLETVDLPAPFVEVSAGIQHARGLLYWIVPTSRGVGNCLPPGKSAVLRICPGTSWFEDGLSNPWATYVTCYRMGTCFTTNSSLRGSSYANATSFLKTWECAAVLAFRDLTCQAAGFDIIQNFALLLLS